MLELVLLNHFDSHLRMLSSDEVYEIAQQYDLRKMAERSNNNTIQKLNFNIDDELVLIEKYEITPTEMFVARLILLAQESDEEQQYLAKFLSIPENVRGDFRDILLSLQNKGIILKSCNIPKKGETLDIYELEFNKNFLKNFYRASGDMGEE